MARGRALLCGLARDVAPHLPATLARIEALGAGFRAHRVILFENDSADDTAARLQAWARGRPEAEVHCDTLGAPRWPQEATAERARAMAALRNRYLERATALADGFDHVIVMDTDVVDACLDGVAHGFGCDGWDVLGSQGIQYALPPEGPARPRLFDTWAYREHGRVGRHGHGYAKRLRFERGGPRVPLASCFGGLALYRMEAFRSGARYDGPDCEHVAFHRGLAARGFGRLFMNPSQLVLYPPRREP
jgi:hypothetical protein